MLRMISPGEVRQLLPMDQCITLMRRAMRLVADGRALQPIRAGVQHPNGRDFMGAMQGYIGDPEWFGMKIVSIFPGNFGSGRGSHQGVVVLFDANNGSPVAIIDAREVTAIRTAAATAAATDVLARREASSLAIFGYGEQAASHLQALPCVRKLTRVLVWGRDPEKAEAFCRQHRHTVGCELLAANSPEYAARESEILCLTTAAAEPFFHGAWLRPGQHLNAVGSSIPTTSEVDVDTIIRTRMFADDRPSALALAGDFRRARSAAAVGEDHLLGTVGDVLAGRISGRTSDTDITLFKSLGMVAEDLVVADFLLKEAERGNVGQLVDW